MLHPLLITPVTDAHFGFILSSFTRSRAHCYQHLYPDYKAYCEASKAQLKRLLKEAYCLVACDPEMPESYFGYIIYGEAPEALVEPEKAQIKDVVYFAYVKYPFRRLGIAGQLVAHSAINLPAYTATTSTQYKRFLEAKNAFIFKEGLIK